MTNKIPRFRPWSDIDLSSWQNYADILTDSLWFFPRRSSQGNHKFDYHGSFIPQVATQVFTRYTRRDEIVLDLFLGSGTSAIEAERLGRRCIGVELKEELVQHVSAKISPDILGDRIRLICGDSRSIESEVRTQMVQMERAYAQLLVLHPPYADIIKFSNRPDDLSNAGDVEKFLDMFEDVARTGYRLLEPGRFAVLVIGDAYKHGQLIPLSFYCMDRMNRVGFKNKAICIKNIEGNEIGKGHRQNLWRYRALFGGYYVFKHEYVMIMFKEGFG